MNEIMRECKQCGDDITQDEWFYNDGHCDDCWNQPDRADMQETRWCADCAWEVAQGEMCACEMGYMDE